MRFVPNSISSNVGRSLLHVSKASPTLLFGLGITSMTATVVLACRATLKVDDILVDAQKDLANVEAVIERRHANYDNTDAKRDKIHIYIRTGARIGKLYSPAIVCGVVAVGSLTGAHNILSRRNAALTAAYATVDKAFREYRDRVKEELGEDKERDLYYGLEKCEIDDEDKPGKTKKVLKPKGELSMYARFFDKDSSASFATTPEYNLLFLRAQQNYANDLLQSRGHVMLNDVYDNLNLARTTAGAVVGWLKGHGDGYIDFGVLDGANQDRFYDFMCGDEGGLWLDFNVDGVIYDKI